MRVEIRKQGSNHKVPPTTFCQLEAIKCYGDNTHIDTDWYAEVGDIGKFLIELQAHEDHFVSFRKYHYDNSYMVIIEE